MTGSRHTVLMEKNGIGRTACFTPVEFAQPPAPGTFVSVRVTGRRAENLVGVPL
jgi:tRNA A37 methylthiotransferase MiaB